MRGKKTLMHNKTYYLAFSVAVYPCKYAKTGSSFIPCTKCSYHPQWHLPLENTQTHGFVGVTGDQAQAEPSPSSEPQTSRMAAPRILWTC